MTSSNTNAGLAELPPHLLEALSAVHDARTTNDVRSQASAYLEELKLSPHAPDWGYALARDLSQPDVVRHFGLTLLDHGQRYGFVIGDLEELRNMRYAEQQRQLEQQKANGSGQHRQLEAELEEDRQLPPEDWTIREEGRRLVQMRGWVEELAAGIRTNEQAFIRNKIAQLWVEVAKRAWGGEEEGWTYMDAALVALWQGKSPATARSAVNGDGINGTAQDSAQHDGNTEDARYDKIQFVLYVLETLSEDVFNREDSAVGMRGSELGRACVDVFIPATVLQTQFPDRDSSGANANGDGSAMRCGDQGWLGRICELLSWCFGPESGLSNDNRGNSGEKEKLREIATRALTTLKATVTWVMPKAISHTNLVNTVGQALTIPIATIQTAAVEVLHVIYLRHLQDDEFLELVLPMCTSESVGVLKNVYNWSMVDVNNIDDQKYVLCKRLSELLANLANTVEPRLEALPDYADVPGLLSLLYDILQSPSLLVSIPVLHSWCRILRSRNFRHSQLIERLFPELLAICSQRLIRYEAFPDNSHDPIVYLLNEDIDTVPERHSFLGNYRRYCIDVIEVIVRKSPHDAMQHILRQADTLLKGLYDGVPPFSPSRFSKNSAQYLKVDAQATVIDATLKGYLKWINSPTPTAASGVAKEHESVRNAIQDLLQEWSQEVLKIQFEDPEIGKKIVQLMVTFATKALSTRPSFAANVLEYILNLAGRDDPSFPAYSESVKSFDNICTSEMQRLAMVFADHFVGAYDQLERRINDLIATGTLEDRHRLGYIAFLFIIIHRNKALPQETKARRLQAMTKPLRDGWEDPALKNSLSSFESFCDLLGFSGLVDFFTRHRFHEYKDWSAQPLDAEGQALQAEITNRFQRLPLRMTKTLLNSSTDKIRRNSPAYELACGLWSGALESILPNLLQMISHAQAFNNLNNWSQLPPELQQVFSRVLTDRFWQSGISTESREDFFARVSGSRHTFEGFASTVRGTMRQIRELGYFSLYSLTAYPELLYNIPDLPEPLADALFRNAHALSAHHVSVLLGVAAPLIELCPPGKRADFVPPLVKGLFPQLERKISWEWEAVRVTRAKDDGGREDDVLAEEMRKESILRQLTYSAVMLASNMLEQKKETHHYHGSAPRDPPASDESSDEPSLPSFSLNHPSILVPIFLFLRTSLLAPDGRSSISSARIFRSTLPIFSTSNYIPSSDTTANDDITSIRTFCTTELLRTAIIALHDPLLVDAHRDLASLIATIIALDPHGAPRDVLLDLPGLATQPYRVDRAIDRLCPKAAAGASAPGTTLAAHQNMPGDRLQRAIVLELLASVRGVGIHEMGRVERRTEALGAAAAEARRRDATAIRWTKDAPMMDEADSRGKRESREDAGESALEGLVGMFG